jgi:hypothetical protein
MKRPAKRPANPAAASPPPVSKAADDRFIPVSRPAQIRALASTLRQDIVDQVQAMGGASVPDLAEALGRPADALYYHVRALRRVGLLVEAGTRQRGRHVETVYATVDPARRLKLEYRRGGATATAPMRTLVASMLRSARSEFDAAIADPDCVVDGPQRELWAGRIKGWLTPAELARANALLIQLGTLLSSPRTAQRDRLYSLQFVLAPSQPAAVPAARAKRRKRTGDDTP